MKKLFRAGPVLAGASLAAVLILPAGIAASDKDSDDAPGISVSPISGLVTSEDGGTATFTVVLNSEPTDEVTIDLVSSDTSEGTVSPASLSFTPSDWDLPQTVTVTGFDDDLDDGDVGYLIVTGPAGSADAAYDGLDAADVSVTNMDDDGGSADAKPRITRVSVGLPGGDAHADSDMPSISADGRFVAFYWRGIYREDETGAYVPLHPQGIFIHDRETGLTERVSVESSTRRQLEGWCHSPAISADGRFVAFVHEVNDKAEVFVHDCETGLTEKASACRAGGEANGSSLCPSISGDGRHVAFVSYASNLVSGDTNGKWDVFVHDRETGRTERVSVADSTGEEADRSSLVPAISADGRYVAFSCEAKNLVAGDQRRGDVFVRDRKTGRTESVTAYYDTSISANGRFVAFACVWTLLPGDSNGTRDVFVYDRETDLTERVSVSSFGAEANGECGHVSISADGRFVAFTSSASNLVPGDANGKPDLFVHDRKTGRTARVWASTSADKSEGVWWFGPSISGDGRSVAFTRYSEDTYTGLGSMSDVFVAANPLAP